MKSVKEHVEFYFQNGLNILPAESRKKNPSIPTWRNFQEHRVTIDMITSWIESGKFQNINVCLGKVSNLWEIDVDVKNAPVGLIAHALKPNEAWICESSEGKLKVFFRANSTELPSKLDRKINEVGEHVELRGDSHLSVLPPSVHPSGSIYTWLSDIESNPLIPINGQELYDNIVSILRAEFEYQEEIKEVSIQYTGKGVRDFFIKAMKSSVPWCNSSGHYFRLAFCSELINNGYDDSQIHAMFKAHDGRSGESYSYTITQSKINELRKKGMHCWSVKKIRETCQEILEELEK